MPDLRMPDLRMPDLSRRTLMALVVVIAGIAVIALAMAGGSGSSSGAGTGPSSNRAIDPVVPIDPKDMDARDPAAESDKPLDVTDPFVSSFGKEGRRKVTIRVTGNGAVNVAVYYRDSKEQSQRVITGEYSSTRTVKGRFPLAAVVIQIPGNIPGTASRATCTIVIDGFEVAKETATEAGALTLCTG